MPKKAGRNPEVAGLENSFNWPAGCRRPRSSGGPRRSGDARQFPLTGGNAQLILNHMVKYLASLDTTFGALADPTRRAILTALMQGQASITELARPHQMSLPAVMKHLRVLEHAGLVSQKKAGRTRHCRLAAQPLKDAEEWLSHYRVFWERQFDALERFLKQEEAKGNSKWQLRNRSWKPHSK